jgi:hypothetical protein
MSVRFFYKFKLFSGRHRVEARRDADAASVGPGLFGRTVKVTPKHPPRFTLNLLNNTGRIKLFPWFLIM